MPVTNQKPYLQVSKDGKHFITDTIFQLQNIEDPFTSYDVKVVMMTEEEFDSLQGNVELCLRKQNSSH